MSPVGTKLLAYDFHIMSSLLLFTSFQLILLLPSDDISGISMQRYVHFEHKSKFYLSPQLLTRVKDTTYKPDSND